MSDYKELRDKEKFADNLRHLSGALSETSEPLIRFSGSDTAKVDPGCGHGCVDLGSTSAL